MNRELMLKIIREDYERLGATPEEIAIAEKTINDFYDRREAGKSSENRAEGQPQKQ